MSLEGVYEIACFGLPQLARSIVAARNEVISIFIEGAVSQWQYVSLEPLILLKSLLFLLIDLANELYDNNHLTNDHILDLWSPIFRN